MSGLDDHVGSVVVEDHVRVEVDPLGGASKLGEVAAPDLIRSPCEQFGFCVCGLAELVSSFADLVFFSQDAGRSADGTHGCSPVEQGSPDPCGSLVDKSGGMQHIEDVLSFLVAERARQGGALGVGGW